MANASGIAEQHAESPTRVAGTYGTFAQAAQRESPFSQNHDMLPVQCRNSNSSDEDEEEPLHHSIIHIGDTLKEESQSEFSFIAQELQSDSPLLPTADSSKVPHHNPHNPHPK